MNPSSAAYPNYFQNPNYPNPNFFFHSLPQPPPQPPLQPPQIRPITPTTPILDLSTTLSSLKNLLSLSQQTLNSASSLIKPDDNNNNNKNCNFISCPYNANHLMPAESLFLHSLRCPSSPPILQDPISLIHSLHYPKTLKPSKKPLFVKDSNNNTEDLCLSLDSYYNEFGSNLYYKDCPGVVDFSNNLDNSNKTFILPGVLSVECANFVARNGEVVKGIDKNEFRILPSDLWLIRREIESWIDYPGTYSYSVLCVVLRLNVVKVRDLRRWVISNSLRYGVVIDIYMSDHISVLFKLCFSAIRREASSFVGHEVKLKNLSFNCPVIGQVFKWVVSQLSVLYGELNAKCFVIHIFRQCIVEVSNRVLFLLEANVKETELKGSESGARDVKHQEPVEGSIECKIDAEEDESADSKEIFVSEVAAAVAALHERALLEAKIKGLREFPSMPRYQRMIEHDCISKRADEERKMRSNYRAIIDHDGLPRKQLHNEEPSKTKTREELLAEERDYKRRRMSYRGKKMKRTTLQVMRDIIEEYMEEIKQAGGIGCFEKETEEEGSSRKPLFSSDCTLGDDELRKSSSKFSEAMRATPVPVHYQNQSDSDHNIRRTNSKDASTQGNEPRGEVYHRQREHVEYHRSASQGRHGRDYHSGSAERHTNQGPLHERSSVRREREDQEFHTIKRREKRSYDKSDYQNKSSYFGSDSASNPSVQKDGEKVDVRDWHRRNLYGTHNSKFLRENTFEDRYDPADSHDTNEDNNYIGEEVY